MKRGLRSFSLLCLTLLVLLCPPAGRDARAQANIDNYLFYWYPLGQFGGGGELTLTDQFGTTDLSGDILYHSLFATPASVDGSPIVDDNAYLNAWGMGGDHPQPIRAVTVSDQFGGGQWHIGDALMLLTPARREADGGPFPTKNHYKCYTILDAPVLDRIVQVQDRFGTTQVRVYSALYLCIPSEKVHGGQVFPIVDPEGYLVLYGAAGLNSVYVVESFVDQFGAGGQYGIQYSFLAVPASVEYADDHVPVAFDFKPQSCPNPFYPGQMGLESAAILGTADFDVNDVDVASLLLVVGGESLPPVAGREQIEDVATPVTDPQDCECTVAGPDGFDDLTLKFDSPLIAEALGGGAPGEPVEVRITGTLLDGTPFEGTDCTFIAGPVATDVKTWGAIKALYQ